MRDIQKVLGALTAPTRREILALIWDDALPAGEIAAAFDLSGATISEHLAVLRDAGLVTMTATGTFRRYRARQDVLRGLHAALGDSVRWTVADDIPERALARAEIASVVIATVDVPTDQATTFTALTDPDVYSRWLGVPVPINDGRFATTMLGPVHTGGNQFQSRGVDKVDGPLKPMHQSLARFASSKTRAEALQMGQHIPE